MLRTPEHDSLHAGLLGLFGHRLQRLLERQPGAQQRGELAGQEREIERREAAPHERARACLCFCCSRCAASWISMGRRCLSRRSCRTCFGGIPFDQPLAFPSLGVERDVFERAH